MKSTNFKYSCVLAILAVACGVCLAVSAFAGERMLKVMKIELHQCVPVELPIVGLMEIKPIPFGGGRFSRVPRGWEIIDRQFTNPGKDVLQISLKSDKAPENVRLVVMDSIDYGSHTEEMAKTDIGVAFLNADERPVNVKQFMTRYPDIQSLFEAICMLKPSRSDGSYRQISTGDRQALYDQVLANRARRLFGRVIPAGIRVGGIAVYISAGTTEQASWVRMYLCTKERKSDAVSVLLTYAKTSEKTGTVEARRILQRLAGGLVVGIREQQE